MSQQPSRRTTRQVRQLFGQLYDKAAGIAESLQPCGCGAGAPAQDGQDVNAMAQDLLAIRQRAGGCICGPPCDGTSVDNPSDETLQTMLARLEWDASVLDDNLVPCGCPEEPEDVEESVEEIVRTPLTLMTLPPEVRDLIWWQVLEPPAPMSPVDSQWFVRIVQRWIAPNENGLDFPFHNRHYSINRGYAPPWRLTFQHANSQRDLEDIRNRWAVLGVNRQVYQEAEAEFWRRTLRDGHMLSFTSDPNYAGSDYYGILTAWTFFNNYRGLYLEQIRRVQISMELPSANDFRGVGVRGQALVSIRRPLGNSNGGEYLIPLIDLMANELPNLQHLSLTFGGFVPDMRVQPVSGPLLCSSVFQLALTVIFSGSKAVGTKTHLLRALCPGLGACKPYAG